MINSIYESDMFAALPDMSIHPGGLRLTDRAVRLSGLSTGMRIADIGCGTGATASYLSRTYGLTVTGLDQSKTLIEKGRNKHPGPELIEWDCTALPFENGSLDAVFLECTLSVIGKTSETLAECARALKDAGTLIVSDVVSACLAPASDDAQNTSAPLDTPEALCGQLAQAGFDVVLREDHTPALKAFVSALYEQQGPALDACAFFGGLRLNGRLRLGGLGYILIIARKIMYGHDAS